MAGSDRMDDLDRNAIAERARGLVREHFERLNAGDGEQARTQLFCAPGQAEQLDSYVAAMIELAPFDVRACEVTRFDEFRRRMHGIGATIWVKVVASSRLGERAADLIVWWYPAAGTCLLSTRPTRWVAEAHGL